MSDIKMTIVEKLSYSLIFREKLNNAHCIVLGAVRHGAFSFMNIFRRNSPVVPTQSNHLSGIGFILSKILLSLSCKCNKQTGEEILKET
jgi:hypothetical protein